MKRSLIISIVLALLCCTVMLLSSCSQWDPPYEALDAEGATVSVKFDPNGGMVASTNGVTMVDVFNLDNYKVDARGNVNLSLADPSDSAKRGKNAFEITKNGYELAGWFLTETVKDSQGREITKLVRKWDFSSDILTIDPEGSYSSANPVLTLTAMWIPHTTFEFYAKVNGVMEKIGTYSGLSLDIPEWDEGTGKLNYKKYAKLDGKTLVAAYLDEAMTDVVDGTLQGEIDKELAINNTPVIKVYTEWRDGEWIKVSKPEHLSGAVSLNACYELMNDITFTSAAQWSANFSANVFSGKIYGNGYTISGIETVANITQGGIVANGGIFGGLAESAELHDVKFDNVSYTVINPGHKVASSNLALFAATNAGATLDNVSLTNATYVIEEGLLSFRSSLEAGIITIGLLCAEGEVDITTDFGIEDITLKDEGVTATVGEDGAISFVFPEY